MKNPKEARRYARVYLNVTEQAGVPEGLRMLEALGRVIDENRELRNFLLSPKFDDSEKAGLLSALGGKLGFSEETTKYVVRLTERGAVSMLGEVAEHARTMYLERNNTGTATVITPVPLEEEQVGRLRDSIRSRAGRDVEMKFGTDPSLLGGVLVKVGSTVFDSTIKGQLRLLKEELTKE